MYPRDTQISEKALPFPDSRYGVTKVFMEAVATLYAAKHGVRGFGMRIGHCAPQPSDARMLSHWLHPDDLCDLLRVGLTAGRLHGLHAGVALETQHLPDSPNIPGFPSAILRPGSIYHSTTAFRFGTDNSP